MTLVLVGRVTTESPLLNTQSDHFFVIGRDGEAR